MDRTERCLSWMWMAPLGVVLLLCIGGCKKQAPVQKPPADVNVAGQESKPLWQQKLEAIKNGEARAEFVLPIDAELWKKWRAEYPSFGGVYLTSNPDGYHIGVAGGGTARFDDRGELVLPTEPNSILMFRAGEKGGSFPGFGRRYLKGAELETLTGTVYFGAVKDIGLVHLEGKCRITMPDKTVKEVE